MPPPDWLSWMYWARDSQGLYHLALIVAGTIGIPLLAIRTFAANRSANASLKQAIAAADQAKTAADRHEQQTTADRERRITESFAKAVEQLGSDKLATRLGGIYTLERIARESDREYWPIMETLTAFVREHAPWPPRSDRPQPVEQQAQRPDDVELSDLRIRPATDIRAILTVLGRRDETARKRDGRLDLSNTDLRGVVLYDAHLEGAILSGAHLEQAHLLGAHLERTSLFDAHLQGANLWQAHLEDAQLWRTHLEGANLEGAHLEHAWLPAAHLDGANLEGAHVDGARFVGATLGGANLVNVSGLTQGHLDHAQGDWKTTLPEGRGLKRPDHWLAATPDEPTA